MHSFRAAQLAKPILTELEIKDDKVVLKRRWWQTECPGFRQHSRKSANQNQSLPLGLLNLIGLSILPFSSLTSLRER
jgi:hypothetical protein